MPLSGRAAFSPYASTSVRKVSPHHGLAFVCSGPLDGVITQPTHKLGEGVVHAPGRVHPGTGSNVGFQLGDHDEHVLREPFALQLDVLGRPSWYGRNDTSARRRNVLHLWRLVRHWRQPSSTWRRGDRRRICRRRGRSAALFCPRVSMPHGGHVRRPAPHPAENETCSLTITGRDAADVVVPAEADGRLANAAKPPGVGGDRHVSRPS